MARLAGFRDRRRPGTGRPGRSRAKRRSVEPATVSLSLENPETRIGNAHSSGDLDDLYPAVAAKVALTGSRGGADLAGLMRFLRSDRGAVEEVAVAGGGGVNARFNTLGKDALFVQLNAGPGQGCYPKACFQDIRDFPFGSGSNVPLVQMTAGRQ